ncbi:HDOD domain-containing protein, partial [Klebsiella variicola]|uniref:HDOD domain-containing protein n=1 Tax=Klebsiella variicola TaxID=244366 RepID=UPI002732284B
SMNLILGLALKHNVVLGDPALVAYAERHWQLSQDTADYARRLARMLELDHERCYSAGILHRLGDLALLRTLQRSLPELRSIALLAPSGAMISDSATD